MAKKCKHCGNWVFDDDGEGYCGHCGRRNSSFRFTISGILAVFGVVLFIVADYLESSGVNGWVVWPIVIIAYGVIFLHVINSNKN